ncbi:type II toxin-antitoxin system VapC family toxin [Endozoicomonas sp. SM1973]|uniref:Type II toxin-antitoxin system VapC family toxin n=1 Tax=Spartinivicinus marinus TaxID=2994442 RepID=A0A853IIJ0_9GAMM|nr:type II toxin-antitoxin system VapC family toxin [Spartinivicinus marinus]MCX4024933.1 type II toxin-antitoxin system VapC family toxin [Spartinivicinus marinus]NYZ69844.1 type II toxin-antitoxin system VapC family toxin [Spartinivicinus marinus]
MSVALVDSNILLDLAKPDSDWYEWSASTLEKLDEHYTLAINSTVYAEVSIGFNKIEEYEEFISHCQFEILEVPREALFLAGKAFLQYRRKGGNKSNVLPDFFIGAHAAVKGYSLISRDKGRFTTYFPTVSLITPV